MPGGPVRCDFVREEKIYAPDGIERIEKSEAVHDEGVYRVNSMSIYRDKLSIPARKQLDELSLPFSDDPAYQALLRSERVAAGLNAEAD